MEIVRTKDMKLVNSILTHPGITKTIDPDNLGIPYPSNKGGYIYITSFLKEIPVGLAIFHPTPTDLSDLQIHVQILPEYRNRYKLELAVKGMLWIWENTNVDSILAYIGLEHPTIRAYGLAQGFVIEKDHEGKEVFRIHRSTK